METSLGTAIPQLPSGDVNVTVDFFVRKLGFAVSAKFPEQKFVILRRGNAEIHFWEAPDENSAKRLGRESSCYIRVENIRPLYDELRERGAPFGYPLEEKPWGMLEMQVDDPYGNAIRFGEDLSRTGSDA